MLAPVRVESQPSGRTRASATEVDVLTDLLGWPVAQQCFKRAAAVDCTGLQAAVQAGVVGEAHLVQALARHLGVPFLHAGIRVTPLDVQANAGIRVDAGGAILTLFDALAEPIEALTTRLHHARAAGAMPVLVTRATFAAADERLRSSACLEWAVEGLRHTYPECSAGSSHALWQTLLPILVFGVIAGGAALVPHATLAAVTSALGLPFLCVTVLRILALREVLWPQGLARKRRRRAGRGKVPFYSVLVPLFRETSVLESLVASLSALDYPRERLEVLLLIEAVDLEMQAALLNLRLPTHFRVLVVPDAQPRTKPKALNFALGFARGDLVVVYDAEDRPQPAQLRLAAQEFLEGPRSLGCVQARLNIYNPLHSRFFTRQFTIEYSVLFDALLPSLERLGLPVPLGGTSNHFRRETLMALSGWDPFNVTEDADLGIRLARRGYRTRVLASTTWEEAPARFGIWLRQRTRWIKGWMQTWLVHTRDLAALRRDLPLGSRVGLHAVFGGLVVSALAQPFFYALILYQAWHGDLLAPSQGALETALLWIACGNLAVGYAISMLIGILSVLQRRRLRLVSAALLMPVYWMFIALAAYRALYQLVRAPHLWEKTPHGATAPDPRAGVLRHTSN